MDKYFKYPKSYLINQSKIENQSTSKGKYKSIQPSLPIYSTTHINQNNYTSRNTYFPQNKSEQNKINHKYIEQSSKMLYDKSQEKNIININDFLGDEVKKPLTLDILDLEVNNFENGKCSSKQMGIIQAYGANTHEGLIKSFLSDLKAYYETQEYVFIKFNPEIIIGNTDK